MKRWYSWIWVSLAAGLLCLSTADSTELQSYIKLRRAHKVVGISPAASLEIIVGKRVIEVEGIVQGSASCDGVYSIILALNQNKSLVVQAKSIESWLMGGQITIRALVQVERKSDLEMPEYRLIAAIHRAEIERWDKEQQAILAKKQLEAEAARQRAGRTPSLSSRYKSPQAQSHSQQQYQTGGFNEAAYYHFIRRYNKRLTHEDALEITRAILHYSVYYGVDPRFIMAIVLVESGFNPYAKSRAGAMGLGQLMPGTARGLGVVDPYDPVQNLAGSIKLVRGHLEKYWRQTGEPGNWDHVILTLAAYNAGSGAVKKYGGVPPYKETRNYVDKVIRTYKQLCGVRD
jgi:soluble lytic murein transglycosylase-like protein